MVTDLINGTYLLNYERALGKHISVALNAGYKGENGLIALSGLDTDQIKTGDITYSGSKIIPEFRYYLNEKVIRNLRYRMKKAFYIGVFRNLMQVH